MKIIGEILKRRREELRLKPSEIHNETFISKGYINALEEGNIDAFPAEMYYIGFLKRYAKYLKLNPDELVSMYYNSVKQQAETVKSEKNTKRISDYKPFIFIVVLILISITAFVVYRKTKVRGAVESAVQASSKGQAPSGQTEKPFAVQAAKTAPVQPTKVTVPPIRQPASTVKAPLNFEVEAVANTWIKVVADDQEVFRGILGAGTRNHWTARKNITFGVGYASGVKVKLNGEVVNVLKGAKQEVNELYFTAAKAPNQ